MNKLNIPIAQKNPYFFENQEQVLNQEYNDDEAI